MPASESGEVARRRPLKSVSWLLAALLMLASASHLFDLVLGGVVPAVQALGWAWVAAGLIAMVGAAVLRQGLLAVVCFIAALLAAWPLFAMSAPAKCKASQSGFSVLSLNAGVAGADVDGLRQEILDRDIDIAVLAEVDEPMLTELRTDTVLRQLPHVTRAPSQGGVAGTVIMTRVPHEGIAPARKSGDSQFNFDQPAIRVDVHGVDILVHAVHTYPPITSGARTWRQTLRNLGDWQRGHRGEPMLLVGDFNASRAHPAFRYAAGGLDDASRAESRVSLPTWPVGSVVPPFVALDHVLMRGMTASTFDRIRIGGTDHKALATNIRVCSS